MIRIAIAGVALATLAAAQESKFSIRMNLVFLPTRVQMKNGETIYGLRADQFVVQDNGMPRAVKVDVGPDISGLSLAVVVQCGRSAASEFQKLRGLAAMVDAITGSAPHEVAVISFGGQPYVLGDFSKTSGATRAALAKLKSCGDDRAAAIDAVDYAIQLLKRRPGHYRKAILLVGETRDHGSHARLADVVAELGITDTVIYTVAFSPARDDFIDGFRNHPPATPRESSNEPDGSDRPPLFEWPPEFTMVVNALRRNTASELAALSGGEYMNFTSRKGFDEALNRIANRIHNYYLLSFAAPAWGEPRLHSLTVRVPDYPAAVIQTRKHYWSGVLESK